MNNVDTTPEAVAALVAELMEEHSRWVSLTSTFGEPLCEEQMLCKQAAATLEALAKERDEARLAAEFEAKQADDLRARLDEAHAKIANEALAFETVRQQLTAAQARVQELAIIVNRACDAHGCDELFVAHWIEWTANELHAAQAREARLREALTHLADVSRQAVAYVGAANYRERQIEAEQWIDDAERAAIAQSQEQAGGAK